MLEYNTRLVTVSATFLGCMAGAVGVYLLLRRKSLIGDTICHAALPGLAVSFLIQVGFGGTGRNLYGLLLGAAVSGALGSATVLGLHRLTKLKPDAILGIVLSVFFGAGMVLFSVVQQIPNGNAAGLENFILGKTASIVESDFQLIACSSIVLLIVLWMLRKELQLLCFDASFAAANGWPVLALDLLLLFAVLIVVIVGANVVGVILVVALMVIPPAAARFWTHQLAKTVWISSAIGGAAGFLGSLSSLYVDRLPTGPAIVITAAVLFAFSLLLGKEKGFVWLAMRMIRQKSQADVEHVLRAMYELLESAGTAPQPQGQSRSQAVSPTALIQMRSWNGPRLRKAIDHICQKGWGARNAAGDVLLTASGIQASLRAVKRHRLLEIYFSNLADLSPSALDRGADALEHALDDDMLAKLEQEFLALGKTIDVPASVHPIAAIDR